MASQAAPIFSVMLPSNLPSPLTVRHHHQSFDRKTQSSTSQRCDTHIGSPRALQDTNIAGLLSSSTPLSAQSTVTKTTLVTTTITTNVIAHPGDYMQGIQPWVTTSSRTDVHETNTVAHSSDVFTTSDFADMDAILPQLTDIACSPGERRKARRRSYHDLHDAAPPCSGRSLSKTRRTSTLPSTEAKENPEADMVVTMSPLSTLVSPRQTPTALLKLSVAPRSSDLIIVRLLLPFNPAGDLEDSKIGEFLAAIDPKRSSVASGEILVSPIPLPAAFTNIPLEECRLSFSWLSGDRIQTTCTSESLGGAHHPAPATKRPKLE